MRPSVLIRAKQSYCRAQVCLLAGAGRTGTGWTGQVGEEGGEWVLTMAGGSLEFPLCSPVQGS